MTRLKYLPFLFLLLIACHSPVEKEIVPKNDPKYAISKEFFEDKSLFPKLTRKYKKEKRREIQDYFNRTFGTEKFSGSFLVVKNGQIIFEKYQGYSNYEKGKRVNSSTPIHLASVGKVLTATAIFRLVEMNKLKLDQTVKSVLPNFPYDSISIRMLLNHRSGIPKYANFASIDTIWNVQKTLSNKDILNLLAKYKFPLNFKPDTKFTYNNSNYAILALIIEKAENKKFPAAMKSLVFDPIGMKNSFVMVLSKDSTRVSQSYKSSFRKIPFDFLDAIYGDKNIYSSPRDLMKFDMAFYNNDFISEELKREIYKGYSYEKYGVKNYGLGIRLKEWDNDKRIFYHNGWWHGNNSCYVTLKKEKVSIIVLSNQYTRRVYDAIRISSIFGDYPYQMKDYDPTLKNEE